MNRAEGPNGETLVWSGFNVCYCPTCKALFNSVAAFDYHLKFPKKYKGDRPRPRHDYSDMPRNAKGYLVTSLRPERTIP